MDKDKMMSTTDQLVSMPRKAESKLRKSLCDIIPWYNENANKNALCLRFLHTERMMNYLYRTVFIPNKSVKMAFRSKFLNKYIFLSDPIQPSLSMYGKQSIFLN